MDNTFIIRAASAVKAAKPSDETIISKVDSVLSKLGFALKKRVNGEWLGTASASDTTKALKPFLVPKEEFHGSNGSLTAYGSIDDRWFDMSVRSRAGKTTVNIILQ
jgi:hypothetical protein